MTLVIHDDSIVCIKGVCKRYGVQPMGIEGWLRKRDLDFPRPFFLRNKRFWNVADLEAWERSYQDTSRKAKYRGEILAPQPVNQELEKWNQPERRRESYSRKSKSTVGAKKKAAA